jgi:putative transposase
MTRFPEKSGISAEEQELDISWSEHRPLHWYVDYAYYWITAGTYHKTVRIPEDLRDRVCAELLSAAESTGLELIGWTLLPDHYHLIAYVPVGRSIATFASRFHGSTARFLNQVDQTPGREVWRQYWDTLLRSEGDYWSRINYMWWNPVRHGYVTDPAEWNWTNLHALMLGAEDVVKERLQRFPAPHKLPRDDY